MTRAFTIVNVDQRTDEWKQARLGRLTGSVASDMLATTQKGESAKRRNLRTQYVLERITGRSQDSGFVSDDMKWGTEKEQEALAMYQAVTGQIVRRFGFLQHDALMAGFSPDAIIDDFAGIVECKAPKSGTHMQYVLTGKVPYEYVCQIRHGLWITGAKEAVFVSYDPRFPMEGRLFMSTLQAKDLDIPGYGKEVEAFLKEVDDEESRASDVFQRMAVA